MAEILPGGQVRYTTTITDPASSLNGRSVSVSYTEGVPCDGGGDEGGARAERVADMDACRTVQAAGQPGRPP